MTYETIYYITHYLWLFQLSFNLILIFKYFIYRKKYRENSLLLDSFYLFYFPLLLEISCGFIFIMYDYVHATRINGPFWVAPEVAITVCLLTANILLWGVTKWRFTWEEDKFVYCRFFVGKKEIRFDNIDITKSYLVRPKDQKYLHFEHYQYILFILKSGEKIKVIFEDFFASHYKVTWELNLEDFLIKKLKFQVKSLTYPEYKQERKLIRKIRTKNNKQTLARAQTGDGSLSGGG